MGFTPDSAARNLGHHLLAYVEMIGRDRGVLLIVVHA